MNRQFMGEKKDIYGKLILKEIISLISNQNNADQGQNTILYPLA